MKRKLLVTLPKLYDFGGDLSKQWYVYYSYRNPKTDHMQRFKTYEGLSLNTAQERYIKSQHIILEFTNKLKNGWSPYKEELETKIFEDQLAYKNVAKVFGNLKKKTNNVVSLLSEFLTHTALRVRPKTFESYSSKCRTFAFWLDREGYKGYDISLIDNKIILDFFDYLILERKLSKRSVEKYKQNLNAFFDFFITRKLLLNNPVYNMPKMRQLVDNSPIPINEMDIEKFKEQISKKDPQLWLASQFIFYCFIRPGTELRLMKIRWIDFSRKIITIPGEFSKNGKVQPIVVPGHFMKLLIEEYYLNKYDLDFYVFSLYGRPGETPLGKNTLRNRFNSHRDNLGLSKDYKFYSWKHTGARAASDAGIPVKDIQMQMRHHSLDVTDKYLRKLKGFESEALKNRFPTI